MSDTPDLTKERLERLLGRFRATRQSYGSGFCSVHGAGILDDVDATLCALSAALATERARAEKAEVEADCANDNLKTALKNAEAWKARAEKAEAERDALAEKLARARDDALEEAAQKVRADTFLITDHLRRIAAAIRAMKGNGNE